MVFCMKFIDLTLNNPKITEIARCLQARYNKGYSLHSAEMSGVLVRAEQSRAEQEVDSVPDTMIREGDVIDIYNKKNIGGETCGTLTAACGGTTTCGSLGVVESVKIKEATAKGYAEAQDGDSINIGQPNSTTPRGRVGKGVANTLTCASEMACVQGVRIRRLTPKECFRLQGWTDDYFDRAALVNSDSQLYKQAGNGVTVNVITAIAESISAEERAKIGR